MEKFGIFDVIRSFLATYGWSFLILVGMGFLIAFLCEVAVKDSIAWLEDKWEGKAKLLQILQAVKIVVIQFFTWSMSVWCAYILQQGMPLPGYGVLFPFWVGLIYFVQYVCSMFGIKGLIERKAKEATTIHLEPTNVKGVYKNEAGELVDKKNNPVTF